jgi:hypothetical protein
VRFRPIFTAISANFRRFSPIVGEKAWLLFFKTNVVIQFLQKLGSILNKKRQFVGEKIFSTSAPENGPSGTIFDWLAKQKNCF